MQLIVKYLFCSNNYDDIIASISSYNKTSKVVKKGELIDFIADIVQSGTSYQLYYYGENTGVPVLRSPVYGQIGTTGGLRDEGSGIGNLKIELITLILLSQN